MPRTIVLLMDGTANEISRNRTNILRLYGCLRKDDDQLVWYDPGVGTFGPETWGPWFRQKASEVFEMATGLGIDDNVEEAYRFLVHHYDRGAGGDARDRIVLCGFSRGAYTARVLAGFIHTLGLMRPDQLNLLPYAYRAYKRVGEGVTDDRAFDEVRLFERILQTDRPPIRALGLFDTVASVIEWGRTLPRLRSHAHTNTNPSVEAVRHAVAIHEARVMFRPKLWPLGQEFRRNRFSAPGDGVDQDVKEVWFRGVHGDVGGGYPENDSALAKLPLLWMIRELEDLGLRVHEPTVRKLVLGEDAEHRAPDDGAAAHNSLTWGWKPLELSPAQAAPEYRRSRPSLGRWHIPFCRPRVIPDGAAIHASVVRNAGARGIPLPRNVPADHRVVDTRGTARSGQTHQGPQA